VMQKSMILKYEPSSNHTSVFRAETLVAAMAALDMHRRAGPAESSLPNPI